MFNNAFSEYDDINIDDLVFDDNRITKKIANYLGKPRYNHYRPAKWLLTNQEFLNPLSDETVENLKKVITTVNRRFSE